MAYIFERRRRTHWLDGGTVACGAKLTRDEFERWAADGTRPAVVDCPKCRASLEHRLRKFSTPATDAERELSDVMKRLLGRAGAS